VVKCGGAAGVAWHNVCDDLAGLARIAGPVVLVHGGSGELDDLAGRLGEPPTFLQTGDQRSRHNTERAVELLAMAIAGLHNTRIVARLNSAGIPAVGLSGVDGGTVVARRKRPFRALLDGRETVVHDDYSGHLERIDPGLLLTLLGRGMTPVVCPPAAAADGTLLNVDADRIAARIAVAIGARELVLLTDVPGLLRRPPDRASLVRTVDTDTLEEHAALATGRMRVKLAAAAEAVTGGVATARLADGTVAAPVTTALSGGGTRVTKGLRLGAAEVTA
jgi:acetylglutamate/LysW-gamma-L-alpha-aminoadipate kinase